MNTIDVLLRISEYFPETLIHTKTLETLKTLNPKANEKKYATLALFISAITSVFSFILIIVSEKNRIESLLFSNLLFSAAVAFLVFAITFLIVITLPRFQVLIITRKMESELPLSLRTFGMLLEMNITFSKALIIISEQEGEFAKELRNVIEEVDQGASLNKSLARFSSRIDSIAVKRAIAQVISAYNVGQGGKELRRIGDELLMIQQFKLKEHASKSAIFGLVFITFAAVLPTFFLIFSILGKVVFESSFENFDITLILLIVFPAISALIILLAKSALPPIIFARKQKIDMLPIIVALVFSLALLYLQPPITYLVIGACITGIIALFVKNYQNEKKTEEIEKYLADALFATSGLPKGSKLERILETWEELKYSELSKQSSVSLRQLRANVKPENVLNDLGERNNSIILKRVSDFISIAINTNSIDKLQDLAEDILKFSEIERERQNILAMQRYTLIFGSLLIPIILKTSLTLVKGMSKFFETSSLDILETIDSIAPLYLIIYTLLTSYFISELEGRKTYASVYFIVMAVIAMAIYYFVNI